MINARYAEYHAKLLQLACMERLYKVSNARAKQALYVFAEQFYSIKMSATQVSLKQVGQVLLKVVAKFFCAYVWLCGINSTLANRDS